MIVATRHHTLELKAGGFVDSCFLEEDHRRIGWARTSTRDPALRFTSYDPRYRDFVVTGETHLDDVVERVSEHGLRT